ncbi:hypothetical protein [Rossellomorea marisflavi]|uniref:hypothetical protein n=1 Tax=Rossellomorea marisflavi TaxID=189381 RepID=UPI00345A5D6D
MKESPITYINLKAKKLPRESDQPSTLQEAFSSSYFLLLVEDVGLYLVDHRGDLTEFGDVDEAVRVEKANQ